MRFPASVRKLVRTVSCNLNSYYVDLIKRFFPNAKIIIEANQKYSGSRHKASKAAKALLTLYDNLIPVITALEPKYRHYTNGPLEGINRKIKQIQRTAYGYRNFEHLKARIYLQTYLGKDTRSSVKTA